MIQFNLLPQVKAEYIKTRRLKRMLTAVSILITIGSLLVLIASFSVKATQSRHISNLNSDIKRITNELESIPELTKIISVQNQLNTLPGLYNGRPAAVRLSSYLDQTTPVDIGIERLNVDFTTSTIEVGGLAGSLDQVNRYVDTLKFTKFKIDTDSATKHAFSNVVLSGFGRDEKGANFTVTFNFDPTVFDNTKTVTLDIPSIITTRSLSEDPGLFDGITEGTN